MVVFDSTLLLPLLWPSAPPPTDPATNAPVARYRDRVDFLIAELSRQKTRIVVPTPVLSEVLVRTGPAGVQILETISSSSAFSIVPFDQRAAVEVALLTRDAMAANEKRDGLDGTWAKIKYDRQIIAIAKVSGAKVIYSDDRNIKSVGEKNGLTVISCADLPLPPTEAQSSLPFEAPRPDDQREEGEGDAD